MSGVISRAELRGISFLDLVCLYVNRAGDLFIEPKQIKIDGVTRLENGNVRVKISPERITNWNNGPIEVIIPPVKVDEIYDETVIDWKDIQGKTLEEVLKAAALPPPVPTQVEVDEYDMLHPGQELKLKYRLTYTNAFFVGETVVRISGAPNNLDSLAVLNNLFIRTEQ